MPVPGAIDTMGRISVSLILGLWVLGGSYANTTTSPLAGSSHRGTTFTNGVPREDCGSSEGSSPHCISYGCVNCSCRLPSPSSPWRGWRSAAGPGAVCRCWKARYISVLCRVGCQQLRSLGLQVSGVLSSTGILQLWAGCQHPELTQTVNGREGLGGSFARCEVLFARGRKVSLLWGRVVPKRNQRDFSGMCYVNCLGSLPSRCKASFLQPLLSESQSRGAGTVLRRHPTRCVRLGVFPLLSRSSC